MAFDILVFAVVAALLIYRLNAILGTRHGDERQRKNPHDLASQEKPAVEPAGGNDNVVALPGVAAVRPDPLVGNADLVGPDADERIATGLVEIGMADARFDLRHFVSGAKGAFEIVVTAFARGDLDTLKPLLSPKLFADFSAAIADRKAKGHVSEVTVHRIARAVVVEAHLGGTMAYVTVDFDVEETAVTKDRDGNIVDGDPQKMFSVEDIWTFTRDTRAADPNWVLIETRAPER